MNGRKTAVLAASLASLMTLAGCLAPSEILGAESEKLEITALENKDLADGAAKAWDPDSKLAGVFGLELSDATAADQWPLDADAGNGKSPAWVYVYLGEAGKATRAFRVTAAGEVKAENGTFDLPEAAQHAKPLGEWSVDSDRAVELARESEVFAQAIDGDNATVALGVAHMEGITGWYLAAISGSGSAYAIVNALTGELVVAETFNMGSFVPPVMGEEVFVEAMPTHAEGAGALDADQPKVEFPFTHGGADEVVLKLAAQSNLPSDGLSWAILDANGEEVDGGSLGGTWRMGGSGPKHWTIEMPDAGDYTFVALYDSFMPIPAGGVTFKFVIDSEAAEEDEHEDEQH